MVDNRWPPRVCWDRTEHEVIGVFPAGSLRWFSRQLTYFDDVMVSRLRGYERDTRDPTALALGMPLLPGGPNPYPPLRVALGLFFGDDMPEPAQRLWEPDVIAWWLAACRVVRGSVPETGNVVVLGPELAEAWTIVLPPLRAMLAIMAAVWPLPADTSANARARLGPRYTSQPGPRDVALTDWLCEIHDDLKTLAVTRLRP